jgi:hypothetical protein
VAGLTSIGAPFQAKNGNVIRVWGMVRCMATRGSFPDASGVQDTSQERPLRFLRTGDRADGAQRKMPIQAFA